MKSVYVLQSSHCLMTLNFNIQSFVFLRDKPPSEAVFSPLPIDNTCTLAQAEIGSIRPKAVECVWAPLVENGFPSNICKLDVL